MILKGYPEHDSSVKTNVEEGKSRSATWSTGQHIRMQSVDSERNGKHDKQQYILVDAVTRLWNRSICASQIKISFLCLMV